MAQVGQAMATMRRRGPAGVGDGGVIGPLPALSERHTLAGKRQAYGS